MSKTDFQNGFALGLASGGVVEVIDTTEIDDLETIIDNSGVLEDTEGTVTEKVEQLIDKAEELDVFMHITYANQLFAYAKTFPTKTVINPVDNTTIQQAIVNLPKATTVYQAFAYWNSTTEPIPSVDELIVNAPNINVSNNQFCMGQMFIFNNGVKKVVLNMPDDCMYMNNTFQQTQALEEVVLNFSTENIITYVNAFNGSTVKRIIGVLDFSSATNVGNMFTMSYDLEEVTFAPNTLSISMSLSQSSKLTNKSKESIFGGLAYVETAQTITLHKDVKILQAQVDSANAKGWTVAGGTVVSEAEYYG